MNGESMTLPACNDDTIELVLTAEQMLELAQAADAAEVAASSAQECPVVTPAPVKALVPGPIAPRFPSPPFGPRDTPTGRVHWHQRPLAKMAANTAAFVAFAWWSVAQLAGQPQSHPQMHVMATTKPIVVAQHPPVAANPPQPVRVVNPFDKTEVFDFPPGTSAEDSREKVAQILLQRARDRRSHWARNKPESSLHTAILATVRKPAGPGG